MAFNMDNIPAYIPPRYRGQTSNSQPLRRRVNVANDRVQRTMSQPTPRVAVVAATPTPRSPRSRAQRRAASQPDVKSAPAVRSMPVSNGVQVVAAAPTPSSPRGKSKQRTGYMSMKAYQQNTGKSMKEEPSSPRSPRSPRTMARRRRRLLGGMSRSPGMPRSWNSRFM